MRDKLIEVDLVGTEVHAMVNLRALSLWMCVNAGYRIIGGGVANSILALCPRATHLTITSLKFDPQA